MLGRYYLQLGEETVTVGSDGCIDVSDMLANIKDIKMSYSRVDLGGVVRKCGSTLELTGEAREKSSVCTSRIIYPLWLRSLYFQ